MESPLLVLLTMESLLPASLTRAAFAVLGRNDPVGDVGSFH